MFNLFTSHVFYVSSLLHQNVRLSLLLSKKIAGKPCLILNIYSCSYFKYLLCETATSIATANSVFFNTLKYLLIINRSVVICLKPFQELMDTWNAYLMASWSPKTQHYLIFTRGFFLSGLLKTTFNLSPALSQWKLADLSVRKLPNHWFVYKSLCKLLFFFMNV